MTATIAVEGMIVVMTAAIMIAIAAMTAVITIAVMIAGTTAVMIAGTTAAAAAVKEKAAKEEIALEETTGQMISATVAIGI
mmetsp:Transcript_58819/g.110231  ORF Transcript_58819/g.110231 Transcript_58819/m.110231 type:complete len:81 (-) Transcript_58819:186-428(-)